MRKRHPPERHEFRASDIGTVPHIPDEAWDLLGVRATESQALKEQALQQHDGNYWDVLAACRKEMERIAKGSGREVSADDARFFLDQHPEYDTGERLDWLGSLFRDGNWQATGWIQSKHPANHARMMRSWTYTGETR
jgi:hypothetical protein